jgi:DMSO/TMAO reductase YedYZ molybdopterin-dependent catalytic subunit
VSRHAVSVLAALAGATSVGLALALGELAAALLAGVDAPVTAVSQQVVPLTPPAVEAWAIRTFGTADKTVLEAGTTVLALAVGAATGVLARRRFALAVVVFAGFGLLGLAASAAQPDASAALALLVLGASVGAGLGALHVLLARLPAPAPPVEASPGSPVDPPVGRRAFLRLAGGVGAAAVVTAATGRLVVSRFTRGVDPAAVALPSPARALGEIPPDAAFPIEGLSSLLTPNEDFYRIDTALMVPRVDLDSWTVRIHGLVERELELTYDDLLAEPLIEVDSALACVSNEVGGSLVGNARWQGVRLVDLLRRAGIGPDAGQVIGRAVDGFTAGFPVEAALDGRDAIVAVGMNGQALPARHGFPARLLVPGLYGYVSATKWLAEIELTPWEGVEGYWVPRGWAKEAPVKTASRIDVPRGNGGSLTAGEVVVAGVAWTARSGVGRVEVAVDGAWRDAELSRPLSDDSWVQWQVRVPLAAGEHRLRVRATDGDGRTQPEGPRPSRPDGAEGWHTVDLVVA